MEPAGESQKLFSNLTPIYLFFFKLQEGTSKATVNVFTVAEIALLMTAKLDLMCKIGGVPL